MLDLDAAALEEALKRIAGVTSELPRIAEQARAETLGHAILGVRRNVYDTSPGAYQRTGDLLRGLNASGSASGSGVTVRVWNSEPYARFVELGQGPNGLTLAQDQAYSAANAHPEQPISFGRSGRKYTLAGPFLAPAQAYSLYRMKQLFAEAVIRAAR